MEDDKDDYEKTKKNLERLRELEAKLKSDHVSLFEKNQQIKEQLNALNKDVEMRNDELQNLMQNNQHNEHGNENILENCITVLEKYIGKTQVSKEETKSLIFKIEYNGNTYNWKIEDESLTFLQLKVKMKGQTGKELNEFYFADKRDIIFLDGMNVKQALFPLSSVQVKGSVPSVKVVDSKSDYKYKLIENPKAMANEEKEEDKQQEPSLLVQIKQIIFNKFFDSLKLILFSLYLYFWISSTITFSNTEWYREIVGSLRYLNNLSLEATPENFLPFFKTFLGNFFMFTPENQTNLVYSTQNLKYFNQNNRPIFAARLIQTRFLTDLCDPERFPNNVLNVSSCSEDKTIMEYDWTNGNITYSYNEDIYSELITGKSDIFDNSGFYTSLLLTPAKFYAQINKLQTSKWVDDNTRSLMLLINFYNLNEDLFFTLRLLFERVPPYIKCTNVDYATMDLTPWVNENFIISSFWSVFCFIIFILSLKEKRATVNRRRKPKADNLPKLEAIKKFLKKYLYTYFKKNFRRPNVFENILFISFLFYYFALFNQLSYYSSLHNISFDENDYTDLSKYRFMFNLVTSINCGVIFIFFIGFLSHLVNFSVELKNISESILRYLEKIVVFNALFLWIFILFTLFCSYVFVGDVGISYYNNLAFTFIKLIQTFNRGSADNVDMDDSLNRYADSASTNPTLSSLSANTQGAFHSIIYYMSVFGYFVFSFTFYVVVNMVIKVVNVGFFTTFYRKRYIDELERMELEERKQRLAALYGNDREPKTN